MNISTDIVEDRAPDRGSDPSECNGNEATQRLVSDELLPASCIPSSNNDHTDAGTMSHAEVPGCLQARNSNDANISAAHDTGSPEKPSRLHSVHADSSSTSMTRSNTTTWMSTSESLGTDSSTDDTESEQTTGDSTQDLDDDLYSDAEEFNQAVAMQNADFSGQGLSAVPNAIFQRLSITRLNLSGNNLAFIPQELCSLTALRHLDISHNCLKGIQLSKTTQSPYITLESTSKPDQGLTRASSLIAPMPDELTQLVYLHTLIMSDCGLNKIPAVVFCLITLRKLNMSQNNVNQLPIEIGQLRELRCLHLKSMGLQTLPAQIAKCSQLQMLNLYGNSIISLPDQLIKLTRLKYFYINASHFIELVNRHKRASTQSYSSTRRGSTLPQFIPEDLHTAVLDQIQNTGEDLLKSGAPTSTLLDQITILIKNGQMNSFHIPNVLFKLKSLQVRCVSIEKLDSVLFSAN
ncbi:hypothetical protein P879_09054 [Paragonimus westermani]|uniref:Uncharacterized protein n=1 Tax=Paragonimus westermani TaxID=34504 RepID=A0A8T0DP75_9TREM|nr:hypothetical protein P879_09054 [Paragonimus westermani]